MSDLGIVAFSPISLQRLALSTALGSMAVLAYGSRGAHAGECAGAAGTYVCAGAANTATDMTQVLAGGPLTVTTSPGFGIDTSANGGDAFSLNGTDGLTFEDSSGSTITGGDCGIIAHNGRGALSVTATGDVSGADGHGIRAANFGTDLAIKAAAVTGGFAGISGRNDGSGALTVTTTGTVTGGYSGKYDRNDGIRAINLGTDLTIAATDVAGSNTGIIANNNGSGALTVTATGTVTGTSNDGIDARNSGTDLTIAAHDVTGGGSDGIYARNDGSGTLSITATGAVAGGNSGIYASNCYFCTDLTINANDVTGGVDGIFATMSTDIDGVLSVTTTGAVTGTSNDGIYASSYAGGAVKVTAMGPVTGGNDGISAYAPSSRVTAMGDVTGGNDGIRLSRGGTVVAMGAVTGGRNGISISRGSGGTVTAMGAVTGGINGIRVESYGGVNVTATGPVTGTDDTGIAADTSLGAVTVMAPDSVTGRRYGIRARASTCSRSYYDPYCLPDGLSVTATGAVAGGIAGISASHTGSSLLSVTATGAVTGGVDGIYARNEGADLTISAHDVIGGDNGIYAYNYKRGVLSVTTTGAVTGVNDNGIFARNYFSGSDLTIAAHDVTGGSDGIHARNDGYGVLSVTVTGAVTGGSGAGITTTGFRKKTTEIALNSGASVRAVSGNAILNDGGNSTTTVNRGASVIGTIRLGGGRDNLLFDGGDFSDVTVFDGGGGDDDTLSFSAGATGVLDGGRVTGFERVLFGDGSVVSAFDALTADVSVAEGGILMPGTSPGLLNVAGDLDLAAGGMLSFELGGLITGTEYDVIDVTGTAKLAEGAMFEILGFGGFMPAEGDAFDILIADDIVGPLAEWTFDFRIGGTWEVDLVALGGREALRLTAAPIPVPAPVALLGSGLGALAAGSALRRRRPSLADAPMGSI